eukprot:CAMPEP_0177559790 /NCGR_PEP_ID=MMETSP0369-20130122/71033_1 /TAXON_ID=447022 ORGANISM="Scrippsiella hangoei-like, Strain SHHI-4" /NCGR_SAMPLE_ID=MMETSP0369 /ASSEMBLY_ACC=CAM_ASM_000364 /LENGTH=71 /DNA_ID=CAMNT_0019046561 /DNA_START=73 /DNA_END=286 /DNA_ORIENTATION=-
MEAEKMGAALIQDCKAGKERESVLAFHNLFVALLGRRSTHVAFGLEGGAVPACAMHALLARFSCALLAARI